MASLSERGRGALDRRAVAGGLSAVGQPGRGCRSQLGRVRSAMLGYGLRPNPTYELVEGANKHGPAEQRTLLRWPAG
ncbi:hypothetical protein ACCAA_110055 [Candidatus Accumulibacter aalborgensis]|uniref:Uncharacterized protein n=1 Tax=Candidatus Accumulibacter aalborgensis TaxID=1860102 RepID=A0A1A8XES8_9PROT|nr:hypothetical protein ACCAA_110055 [Candidatus Accumulibacter aalborgensis]